MVAKHTVKMLSVKTQFAINRCLQFASKSDFQDIHTYFQIPSTTEKDNMTTSFKLWMEPTDILGTFIIALQQMKQHAAEFKKVPLTILPLDIEKLLYGFLSQSNTIRIKMTLPNDFPIRPPKFELLAATHKESSIQKEVVTINCDLATDYSPALAIEKTLLILLSRILKVLE